MLWYIVCQNFFLDSFLFRRQRPCKMFPLVNVLWDSTNTIMWRLCFYLDKNTSCISVFSNKCNTKRNIQWILPNFLFIIFIDQQLFDWNYGKFLIGQKHNIQYKRRKCEHLWLELQPHICDNPTTPDIWRPCLNSSNLT